MDVGGSLFVSTPLVSVSVSAFDLHSASISVEEVIVSFSLLPGFSISGSAEESCGTKLRISFGSTGFKT